MSVSRPEPEVIVNFADGCAYNKNKLEALYRGGFFSRTPPRTARAAAGVKKEDVELLVAEFEFPRPHAEKILAEHGGDVTKALEALVNSPA